MDTIDLFRETIKRILENHAGVPFALGDIYNQTIFECQNDTYLLMAIGWQKKRRVHDCIVHIEIVNGMIWIQADGTEYGIANELIEAGIPKDKIVLGFHKPEIRKYTGFAVG